MTLETIVEVDETVSLEKETPFLTQKATKNWSWSKVLKVTLGSIILISFLGILLAAFIRLYKGV